MTALHNLTRGATLATIHHYKQQIQSCAQDCFLVKASGLPSPSKILPVAVLMTSSNVQEDENSEENTAFGGGTIVVEGSETQPISSHRDSVSTEQSPPLRQALECLYVVRVSAGSDKTCKSERGMNSVSTWSSERLEAIVNYGELRSHLLTLVISVHYFFFYFYRSQEAQYTFQIQCSLSSSQSSTH